MPQVNTWAKPAFEIVLDAPYYFPGDVITGTVKRRAGNAGLVSPHASVELKFFGRSTVRFDSDRTRRNPDNSPISTAESGAFRSVIDLIDERYTLHDGPLHIPSGLNQEPATWPFTIPLPLHPSPACVTRDHHSSPYLSLHPDDISTHILPFTFPGHQTPPTTSSPPASISYTLTALTFEEHGGHRFKTPIISSTLIIVRPPPAPPILDSFLCHRETRRMVQTHRLTNPHPHLNLLQKTKELLLLQPSKIPYYLFNVQVDYPTTIQLDSLSPVPFLLRIGPAREGDVNAPPTVLANSLPHNALPFHLTGIKFKIKAFTAVSLPRHRHKYPDHEQTVGEFSVRWNSDGHSGDEPPVIPDCSGRFDQDENVHNPPPMMDVGELIDLRFGSREAKMNGRTYKLESILYPDFVTYNIKHRHVLRWEVTMTLAKETFMMMHEAAAVIIPSCSWS